MSNLTVSVTAIALLLHVSSSFGDDRQSEAGANYTGHICDVVNADDLIYINRKNHGPKNTSTDRTIRMTCPLDINMLTVRSYPMQNPQTGCVPFVARVSITSRNEAGGLTAARLAAVGVQSSGTDVAFFSRVDRRDEFQLPSVQGDIETEICIPYGVPASIEVTLAPKDSIRFINFSPVFPTH